MGDKIMIFFKPTCVYYFFSINVVDSQDDDYIL